VGADVGIEEVRATPRATTMWETLAMKKKATR
jgi:hypothetical protein